MEWYVYPLVILAGFTAGFINTLAGSGSLVTLPLLMGLAGLPSTIANGTNRVAILLQNVVGAKSFNDKKMLDTKGVLYLGTPAVIGSILGAQIASDWINDAIMDKVIGAVMVIMLFIIVLRPKQWLKGDKEFFEGLPTIWQIILFFFIGLYGGFIQAGVGIFLLAGLVLGTGYDLVRANGVKVGIVLFFTIFALAVFALNGDVNWFIGLILAIGNMLGAWVGAKVAVEKGAQWVRAFLILIVTISAANLLGIIDMIKNLF